MNLEEARQAVAVALAACPAQAVRLDAEAARSMAGVWAMMLEDLHGSDVAAALKRHIATSKWLPSVAELRAICAEAEHGRARAGGDAWGDVLAAVARFGAYRTPEFSDPLVARCVERFGWRELCGSENQVADRARFVELYDKLAKEQAEDAVVGALPGVSRPAQLTARGPLAIGELVAGLKLPDTD